MIRLDLLLMGAFHNENGAGFNVPISVEPPTWRSPSQELYKLNVDAAISEASGMVGIGAVI